MEEEGQEEAKSLLLVLIMVLLPSAGLAGTMVGLQWVDARDEVLTVACSAMVGTMAVLPVAAKVSGRWWAATTSAAIAAFVVGVSMILGI